MNKFSEFTEVDRLTCAMLDGTISQDDFSRLDKILYKSADQRKRYLEIIRLESLLHWEAEDTGNNLILPNESNKIISFPALVIVSSIAAILLAMAGSWWAFHLLPANEIFSREAADLKNSSYSEINSINPVISETKLSLSKTSSIPLRESFLLELHPFEKSNNVASRVLESLINDKEIIQEGETEWIGPIKRWNRVPDLSVPAEKGILPASGSSMLALSPMMVDMESQTAQTVETVQVLDVRKMFQLIENQSGPTLLSASVKFNQSVGECQDSTEYGLTLSAFTDLSTDLENASIRVEKNSHIDVHSGDWSEINSQMEIPTDTRFVVVSLSAKKSGTDALLANTSSFYSDDLELSFSFGDQGKLGPI